MISFLPAAFAATLSVVLALAAPAAPPPTPIVVDVLTVAGSGCAPGTVSVHVPPDNSGFDLAYDEFIAVTGGAQYRRTCQLALRVHVPEGTTYAVTGVLFRGFAHLEPTATATLRTRLHFAGTQPGPLVTQPFTGPLDEDWHWALPIDPAAPAVAPCGENRALNIAAELRVDAGDSTGRPSWIALQAESWPAFTAVQLEWRACPVP